MESGPADTRDASSTLLYSTIVLTLVGALFVSARLWVRFLSTKAHSWDDYFIIGSLVGFTHKAKRKTHADRWSVGREPRVTGFDYRHGTSRVREEHPAARTRTDSASLEVLQFRRSHQWLRNGVPEAQHRSLPSPPAAGKRHGLDSLGIHCDLSRR